ncbi:MAG: hypothetical protein BZY88_08165 [SAR202 cluster bacterium Io17-Chloro-G9]|nr:MAG: hypothetical protein BZY88_08165 [SAR202 cluster bacterium Io17-Chloro-G9]
MPMQVRVVAYDPAWKNDFEAERANIACALQDIVVCLHHIGSTAVPGIFAKPIIDILLVVDDTLRLDDMSSAMEQLGYEVMGEFGIPGRRYFRKDNSAGIRIRHVHAFASGSTNIERHLAFRDYLIAHPMKAQAYGQLKQRLAREHPHDMQAYVDGKDLFVKEHEAKAMYWRAACW